MVKETLPYFLLAFKRLFLKLCSWFMYYSEVYSKHCLLSDSGKENWFFNDLKVLYVLTCRICFDIFLVQLKSWDLTFKILALLSGEYILMLWSCFKCWYLSTSMIIKSTEMRCIFNFKCMFNFLIYAICNKINCWNKQALLYLITINIRLKRNELL